MKELHFDACFDDCKLAQISGYLPETYAVLNKLCAWRRGRWPKRIHCMSKSQIVSGRARGAGHGMTYTRGRSSNEIWMNPYMSPLGLWLVLIHENLHHGFPDASEDELNNVLVPVVYELVTGKELPKKAARAAGLGPPEPGIGDRGYYY